MQRLSRGRALVGTLIGGMRVPALAVTASTQLVLSDSDRTIQVNSGSKVITLPAASKAKGRRFTIKNLNITGTTVKATSGTIDGVAAATGDTASLATAYLHATYESDGTIWYTV